MSTRWSPGFCSPRTGVRDASVLMERNLVGRPHCTCSGTSSAPGSRLCTVYVAADGCQLRTLCWDSRAPPCRGGDREVLRLGADWTEAPRTRHFPSSQSGLFSETDLESEGIYFRIHVCVFVCVRVCVCVCVLVEDAVSNACPPKQTPRTAGVGSAVSLPPCWRFKTEELQKPLSEPVSSGKQRTRFPMVSPELPRLCLNVGPLFTE